MMDRLDGEEEDTPGLSPEQIRQALKDLKERKEALLQCQQRDHSKRTIQI